MIIVKIILSLFIFLTLSVGYLVPKLMENFKTSSIVIDLKPLQQISKTISTIHLNQIEEVKKTSEVAIQKPKQVLALKKKVYSAEKLQVRSSGNKEFKVREYDYLALDQFNYKKIEMKKRALLVFNYLPFNNDQDKFIIATSISSHKEIESSEIVDEVTTEQSSVDSTDKVVSTQEVDKSVVTNLTEADVDEELVTFDYQDLSTIKKDKSISPAVLDAIKREQKEKIGKFDYVKEKTPLISENAKPNITNQTDSSEYSKMIDEKKYAEVEIRDILVKNSKKMNIQDHTMEVYNLSETKTYYFDRQNVEVDTHSIYYKFREKGQIPTNLKLLENKKNTIPSISSENLETILQLNNLEIEGGILLVKSDSKNLEIDSDYMFKVYLDENFVVLKENDNFSYQMFLGLNKRNITIIDLVNNKEISKISHVIDHELTYEEMVLGSPVEINITLVKEELLSNTSAPFTIDSQDFKLFNNGNSSDRLSQNLYRFDNASYFEGDKLFYFAKLEENLVFATAETNEINLPSLSYQKEISKILDSKSEDCIVQLNVPEKLDAIEINFSGNTINQSYEMISLDREGVFSKEVSELTKKIFITGQNEGLFEINLIYQNGKSKTINSFCAEKTYLVEQL